MKSHPIILTIAALSFLAAPATLLAQGPPGDGPGPRGFGGRGHGDHLGFFERRLPQLAEELGLSDEQLEKIQAITETARPEIEAYADALRESREAYRAANDDPTVFDEAEFRKHAAAQNEIQNDLMVAVQKAKAAVFSVLTAEQIEQLDALRGSFGGRKSARRGAGRGWNK
ncbi:MAG: Spy/CpxP family protein refolding chaperone [Acidobacteriota bacterium]|jgi:Spy/CpxP family protein refolding chaperone